ncbi:hypothetical protein DENSPDRAFT_845512 [Dentipellis sp. KUC8613]|nr:hypothetical protein DENSPDRAFT_845512 [Dentipellis sp. KUC8613]
MVLFVLFRNMYKGTVASLPVEVIFYFVFLEYLIKVGLCLHSNHGKSGNFESLLQRATLFCTRHVSIAHLFSRFLCPPTGNFLHISRNSLPCSHRILVSPGLEVKVIESVFYCTNGYSQFPSQFYTSLYRHVVCCPPTPEGASEGFSADIFKAAAVWAAEPSVCSADPLSVER